MSSLNAGSILISLQQCTAGHKPLVLWSIYDTDFVMDGRIFKQYSSALSQSKTTEITNKGKLIIGQYHL